MDSVGIKELKARLSEYVERAAHGGVVIITVRGKEVATLGPLSPSRAAAGVLVADGRAAWSGDRPGEVKAVAGKGRAVSDLVGEQRR